jgi:hypothetical protein
VLKVMKNISPGNVFLEKNKSHVSFHVVESVNNKKPVVRVYSIQTDPEFTVSGENFYRRISKSSYTKNEIPKNSKKLNDVYLIKKIINSYELSKEDIIKITTL